MINLRVLFADDDPDIRDIVKLALEQDPLFAVHCCGSGDEALKLAIEWLPDLVLLDDKMRGMDGPAVLAHLRADRRTAAIPVVYVTGRARPHDCVRLKALGAAGIIAKPFDVGKLGTALRRFFPFEGVLAGARENFLMRLETDARALRVCRRWLSTAVSTSAVARVGEIAHALAGAAGIYGFAGITCEAATLCDAAEDHLCGRLPRHALVAALDRVLARIEPDAHTVGVPQERSARPRPSTRPPRNGHRNSRAPTGEPGPVGSRYSAATA